MNYYDESCKGFEFQLNRKRNKALSINNKNNNSIKQTPDTLDTWVRCTGYFQGKVSL